MMHRFGWVVIAGGALGLLLTVNGSSDVKPVVAQAVDEGCPETSSPSQQDGETLKGFASASNSGVVFDDTKQVLKVSKAGGLFKSVNFSLESDAHGLCAADFNGDGWVDVITSSFHGSDVVLSINETEKGQLDTPPNWADPNYVSTPIFTPSYYFTQNCSGRNGHASPAICGSSGNEALSCADFNNDGFADFMYVREQNGHSPEGVPHSATLYLGDGTGKFQVGYQAANADEFGFIVKSTTMLPVDYNNDGNLDLIVGGASLYRTSSKGHVLLFLNDGDNTQPHFVFDKALIKDQPFGRNGINTLSYQDFTGDGFKDLVVTSTHSSIVRMFTGLAGGGIQSTFVDIAADYPGAAAMLLGADFSLDGQTDMILASDDFGNPLRKGGFTHYYKNNGTTAPFSDGITETLTVRGAPENDFDMAAVFQYDNDPDGTPDFIVANGNDDNRYVIFANRAQSSFAECGDVESGILDLGNLNDSEMVVTAARIDPEISLPDGTSITFFMSNESPANWQEASPCVDDPTSFCVSFPKPVGRDVRWKAHMCSNSTRTISPEIKGINFRFDYTEAKEHYRAGVVVDDGIAYVGAFRQPGNRGHFYAINADLGETYWDFADSLNQIADSERKIFTSNAAGSGLIDFAESNAGSLELRATLGVATEENVAEVIKWQRSPRFGVDQSSRLGSIENSTPAVVGPPSFPIWYPKASEEERTLVNKFIKDNEKRPTIVLVGSRDGALHAIRSVPTNISASENGTEAWAFIPAGVAKGMPEDMANNTSDSYPDGSPTVGDVLIGGDIRTIAIVGGGNGNRSVFALDITETIEDGTNVVVGPKPLWTIEPGGSLAGQALSKPVIARVLVNGTSRFYAIMASGIASENPIAPFTKGRDVVAVDIETGKTTWQFRSKCAITSDIVIFETNDEDEAGEPVIDGYIDRAVWADACGNVYKVDPAQDEEFDFIKGIGEIEIEPTDVTDPEIIALFSTSRSACTLEEERPIAGTIGARPDATQRIVLFFGTGGLESFDPSKANEFYGVYADTGTVRGCGDNEALGRIKGKCPTENNCEKFYGGVVVTASDIIVTRATDAPVGTSTCEFGKSNITGFSTSEFNEDFNVPTASSTVSSLYGDGDALYFATLAGEIVRIGKPRAGNAGEDSSSPPPGQAPPDGDGNATVGGDGAMTIGGWNILQ